MKTSTQASADAPPNTMGAPIRSYASCTTKMRHRAPKSLPAALIVCVFAAFVTVWAVARFRFEVIPYQQMRYATVGDPSQIEGPPR
jgi:hypothetical protein